MPACLTMKTHFDMITPDSSHFNDWATHVEDFFYIREPDGGPVLYCSPAYERIWGRSIESLYNDPTSWLDSVHPEDRDRIVAASQAPTGFQDDYRIVRNGGEVRWVRSRTYPVMGLNNEVVRLVGFSEDITEWKRLEQQLVQSQKMDAVGRLAGGIAHDFNNLLTVINGYSAMIEEREDLPAGVREDIASIRKAGQSAAQLTGQLLTFSRKQPLKKKAIELAAAVREVEPILRRLIREDVDLVILPAVKPLFVCVDPTQFEQVIINLAINARDAIQDRGAITIELHEEYFDASRALMHPGCRLGRYAMLAVSDNGRGMDEQTKDRVFEPFFTTKEVGQGTGLGLATVYGVVKQSGGTIWVYSELGVGSTFRVYLPLVDVAVDLPVATAKQVSSKDTFTGTGTGTVLIVEDEEQVRSIAAAVLKARGYQVYSAANGQEALRIAATITAPLDVLVTDVIMPKMGGLELVKHLVALRPKMRVLYISGYTENAILSTVEVPGGAEYLPKPFTPSLLAQKVSAMLNSSR
jgi:two-component system cell cycle sensor histidine kinase/response regulator CckA